MECLGKTMEITWRYHVISNSQATFEAQFIWRLSSTGTELKKSVAYKKTLFENSAKKNLHYFRKTFYRRCLTGLWVYLRSWIYQGSKYTRVLNIPGLWICQGSECTSILNMPECWTLIATCFAKTVICRIWK